MSKIPEKGRLCLQSEVQNTYSLRNLTKCENLTVGKVHVSSHYDNMSALYWQQASKTLKRGILPIFGGENI